MNKRAVIYTRVSRDDTGLGKSNERQEAECRRLTDYKRLDVVRVVNDISISASTGKKRPGWQEVLAMVLSGEVDYVISWHMDRMTRSMIDLEELILLCVQEDVAIATVAGDIDLSSDMGRMVARILAAVAKAEMERKSARQKLANATRAAEGGAHSGGVRPFGYENDRLTVVEEEADAIREAAIDALAGTPLSAIAKRWIEAGLVSSRANKAKAGWSARGVKNVLTNPRYAGVRMYLGTDVGEGAWEAILDTETHLALKNMLEDASRTKGAVHTGRTPTTLLTGIAVCGVCASTVKAASVRGRMTYSCSPGSHVHTARGDADDWVMARLVSRLAKPDFVTSITGTNDAEVDEARTEVQSLRDRLDALAKLFAAGTITAEQLTAGTAELRGRLDTAETVLTSVPAAASVRGLSVGTDDVEEQVYALPLERKRALVEAWLDVTLNPVGKKRSVVMPIEEQVEVVAA